MGARACSRISVAVSCRENPIWPVAQKVQPIAHPACRRRVRDGAQARLASQAPGLAVPRFQRLRRL